MGWGGVAESGGLREGFWNELGGRVGDLRLKGVEQQRFGADMSQRRQDKKD